MTLPSVSRVGPTLKTLPAAVIFSIQPRLNPNPSVAVKSQFLDENIKGIAMRANQMTSTLAQIESWRHGGIND